MSVVLSAIQEKVNNPSPDDPYEPDIAAVRTLYLDLNYVAYSMQCSPAAEDRPKQI